MKVPLLDLHAQNDSIMKEIRAAMDAVFESHSYILGPAVRALEEDIEQALQAKHAIGCASGTDALILALLALDIGPGDEVITTPFTFFATAGAIHRTGAKPVFADIDPETFNLDPPQIEALITPATKAILPAHLFGQCSDMDSIMAIAQKHGLPVIEDNAQGIGSLYKGKKTGTIGDIGTLSFYPSKNLGAMGDAGMCLTDDDDLAEKLRRLRVHGDLGGYHHRWVGMNSRLDSLQAAALKVKLRYLEGWSEARRQNAEAYGELLRDIPQIKLPVIREGIVSIYNQYTMRVENRDGLLQYLRKNDIGCAVYYPVPLHLQECFAYLGYSKGQFPNAEKASEEVISIPVFSELTARQQAAVKEKIIDFYRTQG